MAAKASVSISSSSGETWTRECVLAEGYNFAASLQALRELHDSAMAQFALLSTGMSKEPSTLVAPQDDSSDAAAPDDFDEEEREEEPPRKEAKKEDA